MKMIKYCFAVCLLIITAQQSQATVVTFGAGADDYITLTMSGTLVCAYDSYGAGGAAGTFNMMPGTWYNIAIDYKNRWGTDGMSLTWDQPGPGRIIGYGNTGSQPYLVPKIDFRSPDQQGNMISGLTARYYDLSGNLQSVVYGEGPLDAGGGGIYENQPGSWNGYGYWSQFEERLTGQIRLPGVPDAGATIMLLGGALVTLGGLRRKFCR